MRRAYFKKQEGAPESLRATVTRRVRFEEVDPLGIVWHGRYPSYIEDARVVLGEAYGIEYMEFYRNDVVAPIKQMHIDYLRPLRFGEEFTIEGILHWSDAARIDHEYIIRDKDGHVATTAYTVQLMLDTDMNLLMIPPPFYETFREKWKNGELEAIAP